MTSAINAFLVEARTDLKYKPIHRLVMGNEAADLDSMASAVTYAYLLNAIETDKNVVPLLPIPRADFKLRTEAVYVFRRAGIDTNALIFLDDVDFELLMENTAELVLVDHNKLAARFQAYGDKVSMILDHHADEDLYAQAFKKVIEPVGSTASLVGEEFKALAPELLDETIATLLYGTILLDTVNLDPEAGRVTPKDADVAALLADTVATDQGEYFKAVQAAKFDTDGLSTMDLLRKDYKEFQFGDTNCGIASALLPLSQWGEKDGTVAPGFESWTQRRNLDVLFSMNAYTTPEFNRDLAIYCKDADRHDAVLAFLQEQGLELSPVEMPTGLKPCLEGKISFHGQANLGISRKKLAPLLDQFFSK